jgi:hypothetical protein
LGIILGTGLCIGAHLLTAIEDRFAIYLFVLLFPFALIYFTGSKWKQNKLALACFPLFFLFINLFSAMCLSLAPVFAQVLQKGLVQY